MKRLILVLCFIALVSPKSYSQLFEENFEYPLLTILSTTAPWTAVSASGFLPILVDIPGGLSFPQYGGSGIGNAVTLLPSLPIVGGEDDAALLTSVQTSGSIYASFMLNVISAQTTGDYFFSMRTSTGANDARVYARPDGIIGYNLGIEKSTGAGVTYGAATYSFPITYLVVVKYTFVTGPANDQMSLFVFNPLSPPPAVEPVPTVGPITFALGTDAADLSDVLLRQGAETLAPTLIIDGIFVDNSWNNTALPVELSSFTSGVNKRDVTLNWTSSSEINNSVFEIERRNSRTELENVWQKIGSVAGHGTTTSPHSYSFADKGLNSGKYNYRLKQIDYNGNFEYYNLDNEVVIGVPAKYELSQNYPNPFNPSTKISYDLPFDGEASINLYDMSGKQVATLVDNFHPAGFYTISFDASNLPSGLYFYKLAVNQSGPTSSNENNFTATKKLMLIK